MSSPTVLSVDAMGGDRAPEAVLGGIETVAASNSDLHFLVFGDREQLEKSLSRKSALAGRYEIFHTDEVIAMDAKPSVAVRRGRESSMWRALEAVRDGQAQAAISAGNTGALMAMALFCLRAAEGVERPAIAGLWPSRGQHSHCVALDMGADIRANAQDLARYAVMGAGYARIALGIEKPRIGLLNVGTEENKGRAEVREAADLLTAVVESGYAGFQFDGFVEANDITKGNADVIVTDGYTGNVALKSAEGTASFVGQYLREAFEHSPFSRLAGLVAYPTLRRLKQRIDPRKMNGGVFLGLNGLVVKSHGGADATGFAAAVELAATMARQNFAKRIADEVEKTLQSTQTARMNETSASKSNETASESGEA